MDGTLHPLHRLWRALPTRSRRMALARCAALIAPRPDVNPPAYATGVAVGGEIGRVSGLGEGARLMLRGLEALDVPGTPLQAGLLARGEGEGGMVDEAGGELPPGAALVLHVNAPHLPLALRRLPRGALRGRRVIGYWAWELPVMPASWRVGLRFVHEVWVPSAFTAAAIAPHAPGRVRVVPHPVACAPPRAAALDRQAFGLPAEAVVTLASFSLASSFERKNPLGAIAAHRLAFGDRADRLLVLKLANVAHYRHDLARLRAAIDGTSNIRLLTATLPAAEAHALTRCCDMLLSLHRSEGFGLVPAEAMLLGVPVVATAWSGTLEYMDEGCAALVPYALVPAHDPRGVFDVPGACWAEPEIGAAATRLRALAEDPTARRELGARGLRAATVRLGPDALAAALRGIGVACGC